MADEFLRKEVFEEHKTAIDRRFDDHSERIGRVHQSLHDLKEKLAPLFFLPQRVEEIVDDLKNVPTRAEIQKDLTHVSQTINTRLDNFEANRKHETARTRWIIGLAVTIGVPLALALLKKVGLL